MATMTVTGTFTLKAWSPALLWLSPRMNLLPWRLARWFRTYASRFVANLTASPSISSTSTGAFLNPPETMSESTRERSITKIPAAKPFVPNCRSTNPAGKSLAYSGMRESSMLFAMVSPVAVKPAGTSSRCLELMATTTVTGTFTLNPNSAGLSSCPPRMNLLPCKLFRSVSSNVRSLAQVIVSPVTSSTSKAMFPVVPL
mmetsp:Transcript_82186/g.207420  ORF Transcript_82186/g.207420 Transcript_82186/m.207420 type:complete len:200 (-) Transcript_82186:323-922(-)